MAFAASMGQMGKECGSWRMDELIFVICVASILWAVLLRQSSPTGSGFFEVMHFEGFFVFFLYKICYDMV